MPLNEAFYEKLIDGLHDGVYYVDTNRTIIYWNKSCERITGYSRAEVVGRSCKDNLLNHCTESGGELCLQGCPLTATIGDGAPREADVFLHHADGHRVPVRVRHARATAGQAQLSKRGTALSTTFCATQLEVQPFTPGVADFSASASKLSCVSVTISGEAISVF